MRPSGAAVVLKGAKKWISAPCKTTGVILDNIESAICHSATAKATVVARRAVIEVKKMILKWASTDRATASRIRIVRAESVYPLSIR